MAKKTKNRAFIYFLASALLLSAGALMKTFPVFVFAGLAPLFAITNQIQEEDSSWMYLELILIAFAISFFSFHFFEISTLPWVFVQAICLTGCFILYTYSRKQLSFKLPKLVIVIYWLGLEYIFLNLLPYHDFVFLADFLVLKRSWVDWSYYTGYLGTSFWILLCNLVLYQAVLKTKISWPMVFCFFLLVASPIGISLFNNFDEVTRLEMTTLYTSDNSDLSEQYVDQGEFIPRTAAWIGALILIFSFVKSLTDKK